MFEEVGIIYVVCVSVPYFFFSLKSQQKLSEILKVLDISLVEFQAPLFSALSVSLILLFQTCLLQSLRFGRNHYVSVNIIFHSAALLPNPSLVPSQPW